jgi:hypothetical protein
MTRQRFLCVRAAAFVTTVSVGALYSGSAAASLDFPGVIAKDEGLSSAPECTLCHDNPSGGVGTATTPFASYLRSRGLTLGDSASLQKALSAALAEHQDSDKDGTSDIDELKRGSDPNSGATDGPPPAVYGCGAEVAGSHSFAGSTGAWLVALGLVLGSVARRRKAL